MYYIYHTPRLCSASRSRNHGDGIVCMSDVAGTQWRSYVTSWIKKIEQPEAVKEQLQKLFDKYGGDTYFWMLKNAKILVGGN